MNAKIPNNPHKLITQTVPVFFFIWDVKREKIIYVSPKFFDLVKGTEIEPRDESDLKPYIDKEYHKPYLQFFSALTPKNNFINKIELKTSNKLKKFEWIEIHTFPVEEQQNVELVVGHIVDISDKKNHMLDLEGENKNFDSIIQIISHDLRQPFTKISLLADLIKEEPDTSKTSNYADKIKNASESAYALLQHFLQLTVLNYSSEVLSTTSESLFQIVKNALKTYDVEIESKQLNIKVVAPEHDFSYPVDKSIFNQAIKNIISNAVKFTRPKGNISINLHETKRNYKIKIADTGIGIPAEIKKRLFKEISSVRRTGLEGQKSTGLGLAITKKIIELHNGKIAVKSSENKGTTFEISLPLKPKPTKAF
ncbi:PAS domain-containing sensor histidine kinase [Fulvivirga ulvae]|uniref:PAS domain-containing sensor histidine kinase n=1 Tax=Fulvivirga ulvae TaxID=2904245 RepID=UPI001F3AC4CA|nr:PAS domain-containing sensor histidine kinase [Fulvivirga ulvae]UII30045.1 PAS domain-containing sensor histidine kinase [Fulvivirga ulvae]